MNPILLLPEVQSFIRSYSEDTSVLAFKGSPFEGVLGRELISQIEGFRKTKKKLPLWHKTPGIYFPDRLNTYIAFEGEQHGFRRAENIKRVLDHELYFYAKIFAFTPADDLAPIMIENFKN